MKKIIAMIVSVCVLFSLVPASFAAENADISESQYQKDIEQLLAIGIMSGDENGNFNPSECLTRAEFAKIIYTVQNLGFDMNTATTGLFSDVLPSHWAYQYILFAVSQGNMIGGTDGRFRPDDCITGTEAIKVLISLLGYDYKAKAMGGYPLGYEVTASELGMLKGLSIDNGDFILREEVAKLINNALDIPVVKNIAVGDMFEYEINPDKTLLTENFHMKRMTGIVTATDSAGIRNHAPVPDRKIQINGVQIKSDDRSAREYLGCKVKYIYQFDKNDDTNNTLVYITDYNSKILEISREDFESFSENKLTYRFNDDKDTSVTISQNADYILNGDNTVYYDGIFDDTALGSITLISSDNSGAYDVVLLKSYQIITVETIDKTNSVLIDRYHTSNKIDLGKDDITYDIRLDSGESISFADIKQGDVITAAVGQKITEVFVSRQKMTGRITGITDEDEIVIGENILKKDYYFIENGSTVKLNDMVTVYFDHFGNAANMEKEMSDGMITAYLISLRAEKAFGEEAVYAKLFTVDGKFTVYEFNNNVTVNGEVMKGITLETLAGKIERDGALDQIVSLKVENAKIRALDTARTEEELEALSDDGLCLMYPLKSRRYFAESKCFSFEVYVDETTPFMIIPPNPQEAEEREFKILDYKSFSDTSYNIEGYAASRSDVAPMLVVSKENMSESFEGHDIVAAVSSVSHVMDDHGDLALKLHILKGNYKDKLTERDIYAYEDDNLNDGKYNISDIQPGDLIKIMYNNDGRLQKFQTYYKYNQMKWLGTEAENISAINRIYRRDVTDIRKGYVFLNEPGNASNVEIQELENLNIVIITKNGDTVKVRKGDAGDILPGDTGVIQTISRMPYSLFIFK